MYWKLAASMLLLGTVLHTFVAKSRRGSVSKAIKQDHDHVDALQQSRHSPNSSAISPNTSVINTDHSITRHSVETSPNLDNTGDHVENTEKQISETKNERLSDKGNSAKVGKQPLPTAMISHTEKKARKQPMIAVVLLLVICACALGGQHLLHETMDSLATTQSESNPDASEHDKAWTEFKKYFAEFIGTFFLVVTVGCVCLGGDPTWGVVAIGCVLSVMIYALGGVSGANFNPAVSFALYMARKMDLKTTGIYIAVQIAAAIAGTLTYYLMFPAKLYIAKAGKFGPQGDFDYLSVGIAEIMYTALLCFVVLNVACSPKTENSPNQFFGLAIGSVIVAGGYAIGPVSGGVLNPAIAIADELIMLITNPKLDALPVWSLNYVAFELVGASLAALLHRLVRPKEYNLEFKYPLLASLICEVIGTFYLVLTVGCNVANGSKAGAFSIAASLLCVIFAMGNVSGANFNPAVSLAIALRGALSWPIVPLYICAQVLGAFIAAGMATCIFGTAAYLDAGEGFSFGAAMMAEALFTFVLCFIVLSVATTKEPLKDLFGWAIGSCITVGGVAIGGISGGSLNPAVSIAIQLIAFFHNGKQRALLICLFYVASECLGAAAAVLCFHITHPNEFEKNAPMASESKTETEQTSDPPKMET